MSKLAGTWKLESSDVNWDQYMKTVGVGFATRQIGKRISSMEEIIDGGNEGEWQLKITSTFKNSHLIFKLGEEFDETTMDGRKVKSVFNMEDGKLVHYQKATEVGIPDSVIVRELTDETTMTVNFEAIGRGIKSTRTFKRFFSLKGN